MSYKNKVSISDSANYAFHIDSKKLGTFLQAEAEKRQITIIDDIVLVAQNDIYGNIYKLMLESGKEIECDFVVDCTGFKRILIGDHYKSEWNSVRSYLPATNAIACKLPLSDNLVPYTEAIAMNYGWAWKIPLRTRYGCGYVYDGKYINSDDAEKELKEKLGNDLEVVGRFTFDPGYFENIWINNCLAVGISSSFLEPLEATTISMMIDILYNFCDKFFDSYKNNSLLKNGADPHILFNKIWVDGIRSIVAFLYLHYITNKTNTIFWKDFSRNHPMPEFGSNNVRTFLSKMDKDLYHADILTPLSWKLYSWILVYAGNELNRSTIQLDNEDIMEYNRIKELVDDKANAEQEYINYIESI
jgi:tryptophan halogenase